MAEAFLNKFGRDRFIAESAGIEPGSLNPIVVTAMREDGIDIAGNRTKSVDEMLTRAEPFDYVITVCDETSAERCPVFPGGTRMHWGFPDPSALGGDAEAKLEGTRRIRDAIQAKVIEWVTTKTATGESQ